MTIKQEELGLSNSPRVTASTRPCAEQASTQHSVCDASDSGNTSWQPGGGDRER